MGAGEVKSVTTLATHMYAATTTEPIYNFSSWRIPARILLRFSPLSKEEALKSFKFCEFKDNELENIIDARNIRLYGAVKPKIPLFTTPDEVTIYIYKQRFMHPFFRTAFCVVFIF